MLTADEGTEMAYVGNTQALCEAIIEGDLEYVKEWLSGEDADPNSRDYTGRAPLHLAVMCSSPAIVQAVIDAGARLVARLADGRTALHLAAQRGDIQIIRSILERSERNEEDHGEKEALKKEERKKAREAGTTDKAQTEAVISKKELETTEDHGRYGADFRHHDGRY